MLGDAWEDLGVLNPSPLGVSCFSYLGSGIVLAGLYGGGLWYKSTDYGKTWVDKGSTPGDEGYIHTLVNVGNGVVVAAMGPNDSDVERSSDWGDSFAFIKELYVLQTSCASGTYCGGSIVLIGTDGSGWTGQTGRVYKSADKGLSWDSGTVVCSAGLDIVDALLYLGNGIVIAGTHEGEIARSTDNGENWTLKIYELEDSGDGVRHFAHLGGGVVLLRSHFGHIYRSADYGANWSKIASIGAQGQLAYAGGNMVFVGGLAGHVHRSLDGGYNWTDLGKIIPAADEFDAVWSLCYFASEEERVLLAGFNHLAGDARMARTTEAMPQLRAPTDLLCEQTTNPTDVTDPQPEFSAIHRYE